MIVQQNPPSDVAKTGFAPVTSRPEEAASTERAPDYHPPGSFWNWNAIYPERSPGERATLRFWRAFAVAAAIIFALHLLVRASVDLAFIGRGHRGWSTQNGPGDTGPPELDRDDVKDCRHFLVTPDSKSSNISFTLPANSDSLYFLSHGDLASGILNIDAIDGTGDDVQVDIKVEYWSRAAVERATVCALGKDDGSASGVGIFTPTGWRNRGRFNNLRFTVLVQIPVSEDKVPRSYKSLDTNFKNFHQELGDISNQLKFHLLSLVNTNGAVIAKNVSAEIGVLRSSNGPIEGTFNTSTSLILQTSNARINANVNLNSNSSSYPTVLNMRTSNARIESAVNLIATGENGRFVVTATDSNGYVDLSFPTQPLSSVLNVHARTSNAGAGVSLHPAYEGGFILRTSNARPSLIDEHPDDPSGEGRTRKLDYELVANGHTLQGRTRWDDEDGKQGFVSIQSSNAPITLTLKDV